MKVIFLDFDGVLNSVKYDRRRDYGKLTFIDESRLPLLKQMVDSTGAVIVLSTTWRNHWNKDKSLCDETGCHIIKLFEKYGLSIYDKTPFLGVLAERHDEIKDWLTYCGETVESFVIIDDYSFGWADLSDRFVKTNPNLGYGLEEEHVQKAIAILNR